MAGSRWVFLIFLFLPFLLEGEVLHNHPLKRESVYRSFDNIRLPFDDNQVNAIFQDNRGMIWLGTKRGLYSFNGYDFHEYHDEIFSNQSRVLSIVQIDDDHLCLGTDDGIKWFDLTDESFCMLYPETRLDYGVCSLALHAGSLWIGTQEHGLLRMDIADGSVEKTGLSVGDETMIYSIEPTEEKLFIASYEHLCYYDMEAGRVSLVDLGVSGRLPVNALLWDEGKDCIWVGTRGCLYKYDIGKEDVIWKSDMTGISIRTLSRDADGNLLIGTDAGLYILDAESGDCTHVVHDSRNSKSLCNNIVLDILCDRNHNVWLGTDSGISLVYANSGQDYIHLSEFVSSGEGNLFTCMIKDSSGDYWLGGKNGLLHITDTAEGYRTDWFRQNSGSHPLRHNIVRYIFEDSSDNIWIASDGGVGRYDDRKDEFIFYRIQDRKSGRNADWAYSIAEDMYGRLWIATYKGGIFVCDRDNMKLLHHFDESTGVGNNVYMVQNDDGGHVWACTSSGLVSVDVNSLEVRQHGINTFNMLYYRNSIWYSVLGKLYRYDINTSRTADIPYPGTGSYIYSFVPGNDRIWFTSAEGVFCADPLTLTVKSIPVAPDNYLCGLYDGQDNELLWGGEDCIVRMSLDGKETGSRPDSVFISSIVSNGRLLKFNEDYSGCNPRYGNSIELKKITNVDVELSSYSYRSDDTFFYKFDNDAWWSALRKGQNHIPLVNLRGGRYKLMLSVSNPDSDPSAAINEYYISVPYPWYLDRKAFAVYLLLAVSLVVAVVRQVHVRNRRKLELREKEMKQELADMKMDFFVNVSHELKTPLSLIMAPVSKMLSETTNARQRNALSKIYDNALRLNTLIHKILDFRQIETESGDSLIRSHVEVCSMVRGCMNIFSAALEEKRVTVNFHSARETVWANIDKLKIESAIMNILSNAIKYVEKGTGIIDVGVESDKNNLEITIADNGCGIDKDELPLVFIRYFQGRHSREGNGIGLYLVKKYIELHGGKISIESGRGTRVRMTVPLSADADDRKPDEDYSHEEGADAASARILIIDDNKEMVAFLAGTLSRYYQCRCAYNGNDGLEALDGYSPDLIIVDEMMPGMDGLAFSRAVRQNHRTATVPIIMLTAKDDMATEMKSIKIGVDVFMPKPFDLKKLQLRIAQLLQRKDSVEQSVRMEAVLNTAFNGSPESKSYDEIFMENVIRVIDGNMERDDFDVSSLADMLAVDSKQLYRKLKQLTGYSPVNYIRKLRMKKAALLLKEDKFTVSEVMFLVGYSNSSYFSKCFAEEFGMKPKDYIIINRNKDKRQIQDMSD